MLMIKFTQDSKADGFALCSAGTRLGTGVVNSMVVSGDSKC